jgi:hypothetical protein
MQLELSAEDRELLIRIVAEAIGEIRVEVRRTREPTFHDRLVAEEDRLKALLERLERLGA